MLNIVCAQTQIISWGFGAAVLDIAIIYLVTNEVSELAVLSRPEVMLPLVIALIPGTLLGYFVGMFISWPITRAVCSRFNGAPFRIGDAVLILSGPLKGTVAEVYETPVGQGGWNLLRLEIGPKNRKEYSDIFEEYSVLRIRKGEQDGAANGSQPIRSG
jgi:hypothetical protein